MEVECLSLKDLNSPWNSFTRKPHDDVGQSEKKENICAERKRSTPLKPAEAAVPISLIKKRPATPDLTPINRTCLAEPWTPTANLKMLISAASPDIRDREMKKMLFRPIENENKPAGRDDVSDEAEVDDSCQFEVEDDTEKKPSRKEKSLGLLCKKFLALYPDYPPLHKQPILISLDEVATSLGVGRRRIYDIINVLESLTIVGRIAKNSYIWYGRQQLEVTLEELQRRGRQQGYHLQMEIPTEERGAELDSGQQRNDSNATRKWKDKSLRIMSQKFVMLFLVSKTKTVTLDSAAKVLIEEGPDSTSHSSNKNKVRRLYDIANVLTSLSLIKKVHVHEEKGRKPAFKWLGPVDFKNSGHAVKVAAVAPADTTCDAAGQKLSSKPKLTRHASLNITPTSVAVQRKVSSAPGSPHSSQMVLPHQPAVHSTKSTSSSTLWRLQNDTDDSLTNGLHSPTETNSRLLPLSSQQGAPLHPEHLFSSSSTPHCVAYLPIMSQSPVLMLYRAPDSPDQLPEGQTSPRLGPEERRKRRKEEAESEEMVAKKLGLSVLMEHDKVSAEPYWGAAGGSQPSSAKIQLNFPTGHDTQQPLCGTLSEEEPAGSSGDPARPSHYLYVPNNAALNNLGFLHPAGQSSAAHPPISVSTLMLPYVLVPSAALPHYPVVAGGVQQQGSDAPTPLRFSLPAVMSSAHFMVGAAPCGLTPEVGVASFPAPSATEQTRLYGSAVGAPPLSPSEPPQTGNVTTAESLTPRTPKESTVSASKAFFQTPGTLGSAVRTAPADRKRGSAQRRLDIGHPPTT